MLERLSKTNRNIALIAIAVLLGWFAWSVRAVLNPLILGYLLAYILRPLVQKLQDRGMRRRSAVNIIFVLAGIAILVIGGGVFVQGRQFVENQVELAKRGEDPFTKAEKSIDALLGRGGDWFEKMFRSDAADAVVEESASPNGDEAEKGEATGDELEENRTPERTNDVKPVDTVVTADLDDHSALTIRSLARAWVDSWDPGDTDESDLVRAQVVLGYVQRIFGGVLSVLGFLVLLPVYTYFLLFELERIHDFVRLHVPKKERERVTRIGRKVGSVIANFFRGRLLICVLKGLVLALGLSILQVPYGFLLGMLAGFFSLIPFAGPAIGFGITVLVALQKYDEGLWLHLGLISAVFVLAEFLEGYVFIPKILGDTLGLHPVVILLAVFVGGAALGLFGFLIAIPLAATLIILFRELVMPAIQDFAEEDSHVDDDVGPTDSPGLVRAD